MKLSDWRFARSIVAIVAVLSSMGCGAATPVETTDDNIGAKEQFIVWSPSGTIVPDHTQWHNGSCGQPGARLCPQSGDDFLSFHRRFLKRLRDDFNAQLPTHPELQNVDISPWVILPPEMTNPANGWNPSLQAAEAGIWTGINPNTGVRFASLDEYGLYIELNYHNPLHGIASFAYGESQVGTISMSPTSTYFFKIHGLIEMLFQRFQRGDFNRDGLSDLFVRNTGSGANQIWLTNGTSTPVKLATTPVPTGGCNWYVGATVDLDYDGNLDLVWHGPACSAVYVWPMNGATHLTTGDIALPGVNGEWTLIGSGDFNQDGRPDLAWRHNASSDIHFWKMNAAVYEGSVALDVPSGFTPVAVADFSDFFTSGIILQSGPASAKQYSGLTIGPNFAIGSVTSPFTGMNGTDTFSSLAAVGRFHNIGRATDLVFRIQPPVPTGAYAFSMYSSTSPNGTFNFTPTSGGNLPAAEWPQGPR